MLLTTSSLAVGLVLLQALGARPPCFEPFRDGDLFEVGTVGAGTPRGAVIHLLLAEHEWTPEGAMPDVLTIVPHFSEPMEGGLAGSGGAGPATDPETGCYQAWVSIQEARWRLQTGSPFRPAGGTVDLRIVVDGRRRTVSVGGEERPLDFDTVLVVLFEPGLSPLVLETDRDLAGMPLDEEWREYLRLQIEATLPTQDFFERPPSVVPPSR